MENIIQKLKKIKALADRGSTHHERDTARMMLEELLIKYDVTIEELSSPEKKKYPFNFHTATEKKLLIQIVAHVLKINRVTYWKTRNTRRILFEMTAIEAALVGDYWAVYREPLKKEISRYIDTLYTAYLSKHKLFAPPTDEESDPDEDFDHALFSEMVRAMKNVDRPVKKIEG